jgi:hypothetical protein
VTTAEIALLIAGASVVLTLIWNIYQATVGRQKADQALQAADQDQDTQLAGLKAQIDNIERELARLATVTDRVSVLEVKAGLFWGIVEDLMAKYMGHANPIHFSLEEMKARDTYMSQRSNTPTPELRILEVAIERELKIKEVPPDEALVFTLILSAIKAQLVDRGERVTKAVLS